MPYALSYIAALMLYAAADVTWLSLTGVALYRRQLGEVLLPGFNIPPAIAFYLIYPVGLVTFAIMPALKGGSITQALLYGALLGAIAYATYDLTNYATLRNWTVQITVIDVCWGAFASAVVAALAYLITNALGAR